MSRNAAQQASQKIDEFLLSSKDDMDRKRRALQILLIGQSESGKSSVVKNFQMQFAPRQFAAQRMIWKTVIYLNLIGSIKTILDALQEEWESTTDATCDLNRDLRRIRLGLSPLLLIGTYAKQLISPNIDDTREPIGQDGRLCEHWIRHRHDVFITPGSRWKENLQEGFVLQSRSNDYGGGPPYLGMCSRNPTRRSSKTGEMDFSQVLVALKEDIVTLWMDSSVQNLLKRRGLRLQDAPSFFLNDIDRIADPNYTPTDRDILRARTCTLGVEEHHFIMERDPKGADLGSELYITDVGGSRSQRPKWAAYFEHVQTILFLAPLSFNQTLEEAPGINRLEDTLNLWKEICRNKLLANAMLVVFFNKKDILAATLRAGVKVRKYVPSYGELPNEVVPVTKYFCDKFKMYMKKYSPAPRPFIYYETCAIDHKLMAPILQGVRQTIAKTYLLEGQGLM